MRLQAKHDKIFSVNRINGALGVGHVFLWGAQALFEAQPIKVCFVVLRAYTHGLWLGLRHPPEKGVWNYPRLADVEHRRAKSFFRVADHS